VRDDLIEHIDMAAISLAAAGIPIPERMQAKDVFAKDYQPRETVFAARDRCDETMDRIRSVRNDRFLYIRNYYPERPHLQPNAYKDGKAILQSLRALHEAGRLDALTEKLLFSPSRPAEELYEWTTDQWQITNLAAEPAHRETLVALRGRLDQWIDENDDAEFKPEAKHRRNSVEEGSNR
jgi:hypothetical protein